MGGRKVCFIDNDGQVGTCIKDDEDCSMCESKVFSVEKKVKELELTIFRIKIDDVEIPIEKMSVKLDMKTNKYGTKQLNDLVCGKIVITGLVAESAPLSKERISRSWNMNVELGED